MALADEVGFPHKGFTDFVDNKVDPTTARCTPAVWFPNPERALGPGFFARMRIPAAAKYPALLIPRSRTRLGPIAEICLCGQRGEEGGVPSSENRSAD